MQTRTHRWDGRTVRATLLTHLEVAGSRRTTGPAGPLQVVGHRAEATCGIELSTAAVTRIVERVSCAECLAAAPGPDQPSG